MANPKSKQDLEEYIALCKEEKCELQSTIERSKARIKELDAKIDAASRELSGQLDLFEGLL
jgi:predicted RNase H-like nuclease (RuvC/YqgF family)